MNGQNIISATIITIGDELLIGQTIDTNSAWIASALNKIGIQIEKRIAIGDNWNQIWDCLEKENQTSSIVLITGGLGPTSDDITKPLLCKFFNGKMIVDDAALANVKNIFENILKRPLLERNLKQAEVPDTCTVIQNERGTAPGMWFEKNNTIFVSMPGVPHEMKGMMSNYIIPALKKRFELKPILHKTLLTAGIGESFLAEMLIDFEKNLPENIKLAYLPNYGMVRLRLSANMQRSDEKTIDNEFELLKAIVKDHIVADKDINLPEAIAEIFINKNLTLSIAESCTGGYISHLLTSIPGSSRFFLGGVVSYANEVKRDMLDVPQSTIEKHGAVSIQTVEKMAEGVRKKTGSDISLATSGVMGPGGGSEEKPVGYVCVAISTANKTISTTFQFRFDRTRNIELTAVQALNFMRKNME
jgi:nicotinamide-nucleotide amidase